MGFRNSDGGHEAQGFEQEFEQGGRLGDLLAGEGQLNYALGAAWGVEGGQGFGGMFALEGKLKLPSDPCRIEKSWVNGLEAEQSGAVFGFVDEGLHQFGELSIDLADGGQLLFAQVLIAQVILAIFEPQFFADDL